MKTDREILSECTGINLVEWGCTPKVLEAMNIFASQDKWISGEVPKDGTKIIRWHRIWKIPQCVFYNENLSKTHSYNWITGDNSQSYPEDSYLPDLYQPLPKAPNTK